MGEKKAAALARLEVLLTELAAAQADLAQWEEYDLRREDGSGAQDRRHEERGENLKNRVWQASQEVEAQRKLIATLP
ncbi:hypothetical protein LSB85_004680 [Salmonella enterica]|nr:hypothetical protein [Salmonella enterica subsp. enterica serovar Gaminara]EIP3952776.1 hypothetical protein [Salmonella enterica]